MTTATKTQGDAMTLVITYQLAYNTQIQVSLCPKCEARNDHGLGTLGPCQHGLHKGDCDSPTHLEIAYIPCREEDIPRGVKWDVPSRCTGQIVETAYGAFGRDGADYGDPYRRRHDRSDGTTKYYRMVRR